MYFKSIFICIALLLQVEPIIQTDNFATTTKIIMKEHAVDHKTDLMNVSFQGYTNTFSKTL